MHGVAKSWTLLSNSTTTQRNVQEMMKCSSSLNIGAGWEERRGTLCGGAIFQGYLEDGDARYIDQICFSASSVTASHVSLHQWPRPSSDTSHMWGNFASQSCQRESPVRSPSASVSLPAACILHTPGAQPHHGPGRWSLKMHALQPACCLPWPH